jgi:DNA-binding response OmpR family regulator
MEQRILAVDDDPQILRLLRASLEQVGYQVFVAYDGEED